MLGSNSDIDKFTESEKSVRVILIVLDSFGIGALPDAASYGDSGADTLGHIVSCVHGFDLPNLRKAGLANIEGVTAFPPEENPTGAFGRAAEFSSGKDTTTGHWEIAGMHHNLNFPYFPDGFPPALIEEFEKRIATKILGNKVASGTAIIDELGETHMETGFPIVYTSADSVFQIAMHEETISLHRQDEICMIARNMLVGDFSVARVIGRPFTGSPGNFSRTSNRKDYSIEPPGLTVLDLIFHGGQPVSGVGKIKDIFAGKGITRNLKTVDNSDGISKTIGLMKEQENGLIFTNLIDFDMLFGHRRDPEGYANALMEFDRKLPEILNEMRSDDILILTADHGNDPTHPGTDHTREYIPIILLGKQIKPGKNIGTRNTFSDIGATIAKILGMEKTSAGISFYESIHPGPEK